MAGRFEQPSAKRTTAVVLYAFAAIFVVSCASAIPTALQPRTLRAGTFSHTVLPGETIYHIARIYGVSPASLMAVNGLSDPRHLSAGQVLIIPAVGKHGRGTPFPWPAIRADRQFAWPVSEGLVSSPFGMRNGVMHDGIDIAAGAGTPIHAAEDGTVIFAGHLHGYGNAVILQHIDGYVTVYGHNERNLVAHGERVLRGQVIAELGASGRTTGPNLHFEVRFHGLPQNPLAYLPQPDDGISFARNGAS